MNTIVSEVKRVKVDLKALEKAPQFHHILRLAILDNALHNVSYLRETITKDRANGQVKERHENALFYLIVQNMLHLAAAVEVFPQLFNEMSCGRPLEKFVKEDSELKQCVERLKQYLPENEKYKCAKGEKSDLFEDYIKAMRDAFGAHVVSEPGGRVLKKALRALIETYESEGKATEGQVILVNGIVINLFADDVLTTAWQVHGLGITSESEDSIAREHLLANANFAGELKRDIQMLCSKLIPAYLRAFNSLMVPAKQGL